MRAIGISKGAATCVAAISVLVGARAQAQTIFPSRVGGAFATRGDGTITAVIRGFDAAPNFAQRAGNTGAGWSKWDAWYNLGPLIVSAPVALMNGNSRMLVVARSDDSRLYSKQETAAGSKTFDPWVQFSPINSSGQTVPAFAGQPAMVRRSDGRLALYATDVNGKLWEAKQGSTGGAWGTWVALGSPGGVNLRNSPVLAMMNRGGFVAFSAGTNNHLYCRMQANDVWGSWTDLGGTVAANDAIAAGLNSNGRVSVFINTSSSTVAVRTQAAVDANSWTPTWVTLPGGPTGHARPAVANHYDGRLAVFFYPSGGGTLWWQSQTAPSGTSWSGWSSLQTGVTSDPVAITDTNGVLHVLVQGTFGYLYERRQSAANSTSWSQSAAGYLGGPFYGP